MNRVVISFGANIQPHENITKAKKIIAETHSVLAESHIVETEPIGNIPQPRYINGAILIKTEMNQSELKNWLKAISLEIYIISGCSGRSNGCLRSILIKNLTLSLI